MQRSLSQAEVEERVSKKFRGQAIVISNYTNRRSDITLKCLKCEYEWKTTAGNVIVKNDPLQGQCQNCLEIKRSELPKLTVKRNCKLCDTMFVLNRQHGGQNREFCYNCLPSGMDKKTRESYKRKLIIEVTRKEKETNGCFICEYNKCSEALEWHHIEKNKELDPSILLHRSYSKYLEEIKKCRLLCANCHRELHFYEKIQQNNMET